MRGVVHDGGGQSVVRHQVRDGARALVLDDVAVDDGVSGEEPVLEVLLAEHRGQVVRAQKLIEKAAGFWNVRGLELPQALRLRLLR